MTLSMYECSVPVFLRHFDNTVSILKKAAAHAEEKKIDPLILTGARLAPDMFPLSRQIQIAADMAKGCAARLAGEDVPSYADTETTFPELQARIEKTVEFVKAIAAYRIDGSEDRTIALKVAGNELQMSGRRYLFDFVYPNFFFHLSTAYGILRHNGVALGKMDFLGGV